MNITVMGKVSDPVSMLTRNWDNLAAIIYVPHWFFYNGNDSSDNVRRAIIIEGNKNEEVLIFDMEVDNADVSLFLESKDTSGLQSIHHYTNIPHVFKGPRFTAACDLLSLWAITERHEYLEAQAFNTGRSIVVIESPAISKVFPKSEALNVRGGDLGEITTQGDVERHLSFEEREQVKNKPNYIPCYLFNHRIFVFIDKKYVKPPNYMPEKSRNGYSRYIAIRLKENMLSLYCESWQRIAAVLSMSNSDSHRLRLISELARA